MIKIYLMQKKYYIGIGILVLAVLIAGCVTQIDDRKNQKPPAEGKGVVFGNIGMYKGNCMPSPDRGSCNPGNLKATAYITKPTEKYQVSLLVESVETNEEGYFELELEPGDYSLFVYDNLPGWENWNECGDRTTCDSTGAFTCDGWSCPGGKCACKPFKIVAGERTEVNANIDHAAW